jgi:hypothetical protein
MISCSFHPETKGERERERQMKRWLELTYPLTRWAYSTDEEIQSQISKILAHGYSFGNKDGEAMVQMARVYVVVKQIRCCLDLVSVYLLPVGSDQAST